MTLTSPHDDAQPFLAPCFEILHPEAYAELLVCGRKPARSAVVTVDDGFQNLLDYALPVAETLRIPLLAFVGSRHLEGGP